MSRLFHGKNTHRALPDLNAPLPPLPPLPRPSRGHILFSKRMANWVRVLRPLAPSPAMPDSAKPSQAEFLPPLVFDPATLLLEDVGLMPLGELPDKTILTTVHMTARQAEQNNGAPLSRKKKRVAKQQYTGPTLGTVVEDNENNEVNEGSQDSQDSQESQHGRIQTNLIARRRPLTCPPPTLRRTQPIRWPNVTLAGGSRSPSRGPKALVLPGSAPNCFPHLFPVRVASPGRRRWSVPPPSKLSEVMFADEMGYTGN